MTQNNTEKKEKGALRKDQNELINLQGFSFSGYERDPLYMNVSADRANPHVRKFMDISGISGIDSISDGRAAVFADFDNDGDYDVLITTIQGESHLLFRNNVGQDNNYLRVALEGSTARGGSGRDAFSSVVRVVTSQGTLTKIKSGGSGFISQHDPRLLFGLGRDPRAQAVEVTWAGGKVEKFDGDFAAGSYVLLREGAGRAEALKIGRASLPDPLTKSELFARGLKIGVGRQIPDVTLKTTEGREVRLREMLKPGRKLLVNVWATWCAPCAREMPELEKLSRSFAANGVDLVGLNVDTEPTAFGELTARLRDFAREKRVGYRLLVGGVSAIESLYATDDLSVPMSFVVDDKGTVTDIIPGWSDETQGKLQKLAGKNQ